MLYTAALSDSLPLILFFLFFSRSKSNVSLWIIILYTLISITIFQASAFLPYNLTHFLVSFNTLAEYLLFALILYFNIRNEKIRKLLILISILYFLFSIYYALTVKIKTIDTIPIGIETIIILCFAFYFLYERMNEPAIDFIYTDFRFWIMLGMIIYLAGSFFIYIFSDQVDRNLFNKYLSLTYVFYALKNILFALGIYMYTRKEPQKVEHKNQNIPYLDIN